MWKRLITGQSGQRTIPGIKLRVLGMDFKSWTTPISPPVFREGHDAEFDLHIPYQGWAGLAIFSPKCRRFEVVSMYNGAPAPLLGIVYFLVSKT